MPKKGRRERDLSLGLGYGRRRGSRALSGPRGRNGKPGSLGQQAISQAISKVARAKGDSEARPRNGSGKEKWACGSPSLDYLG